MSPCAKDLFTLDSRVSSSYRAQCISSHCSGSARAKESFTPDRKFIRAAESDGYRASVQGPHVAKIRSPTTVGFIIMVT